MEYIQFTKGTRYPQKRAGSSLHCIDQNKLIVVGGGNRSEEFGDVWQAEINQEGLCEWKELQIPLSAFTPRTGHASAQVSSNEIFVYGGQNFKENKHSSDFFELDLEGKTMKKINRQKSTLSINEPTERNSSTMVYNSVDNQLLLFGGADSQEPLSDLFAYDIDLGVWKKLETKGETIQGLEMHSAHFYCADQPLKASKNKKNKKKGSKAQQNIIDIDIGDFTKKRDETGKAIPHEVPVKLAKVNIEFDEANAIREDGDNNDEGEDGQQVSGEFPEEEEEQKQDLSENQLTNQDDSKKQYKYMIVIGGRHCQEVKNEVYALDLTTLEWKLLKRLPNSVCAHASVLVDDTIYIYGGTDGQQFFDQIFILQITNQKIYEVEITGEEKKQNNIVPRIASAMTYDAKAKKIYIFGGSSLEDESTSLISLSVNKINTSNKSKKV